MNATKMKKTLYLAHALEDEEYKVLQNYDFKDFIYDAIPDTYITQDNHPASKDVKAYIRSLIMPIIEANKHVIDGVNRKNELLKQSYHGKVTTVLNDIYDKTMVGLVFEYKGFIISKDDNTDLIMLGKAEEEVKEDKMYRFITIQALAEFIALNI